MILFPHAKINLGLHVTARRPDGFHEIETCFYPVRGLRDAVELLPGGDQADLEQHPPGGALFSSTGLPVDCPADKNLCVMAFELLRGAFPGRIPATRIHLHKVIPFGAGLGGGSADATAVLRGINELYDLRLTTGELTSLAAQLGSDTAYFLHERPMIGTGRGQVLTPAPVGLVENLKGWWLLIVKPDAVGISTREAYSLITPRKPAEPLAQILQRPVESWRGALVNDFEGPIYGHCPQIGHVRDRLYDRGAAYAALSGSGSAVYGLFREQPVVNQGDWVGCFFHLKQL